MTHENPRPEDFENWDVDPYAFIPRAEDDKPVSKLLEEFKAGQPPTKRNRRIPFVLFHQEVINSRPIRTKGEDGKEKVQYKRERRNELFFLDCSGSHAQEAVILNYLRRTKGIVAYWFPKVKTPEPVKGFFDTTRTKEGLTKYANLARFCEQMRGVSPARLEEMASENEQLKRQLEEANALLAKSQTAKKEIAAKNAK